MGRSTVNSVSKVLEIVNAASTGPLCSRKLCILVALGVSNAFNCAMLEKIGESLEKRHVPVYHLQII